MSGYDGEGEEPTVNGTTPPTPISTIAIEAMFPEAVKERLHARVAIDGPTGAGKTFTAQQWARILVGPEGTVATIDTENRSAAYYAETPGAEVTRVNYWDPPFRFRHMEWRPPYEPFRLAQIIKACAQFLTPTDCSVIDSLTHFWFGEGGTLEQVDNAAKRTGSSFTAWQYGTPMQRHMVDTIIHAPFHVICTMRSKMDYVLEEQTKGGRKISVPKKVGLAPEQRAGIEYEFTVVADMDWEHTLVVAKSRADVVADVVAPRGRVA